MNSRPWFVRPLLWPLFSPFGLARALRAAPAGFTLVELLVVIAMIALLIAILLPANRHHDACNLSFADGHVEHWKWAVPKVFRAPGQAVEPPEEWRDYDRLRAHMRKAVQ